MRPELWVGLEGNDEAATSPEDVKSVWFRWSDVRRVCVRGDGQTFLIVDHCDEPVLVDYTPAELFEMARKFCEEHD